MISPVIWAALAGVAAGIVRAAWKGRRDTTKPKPGRKPPAVRSATPSKPRAARRSASKASAYSIRGHAATDEQVRAIDLALTGETLKIEAAAGSGKTSTLIGIAERIKGKGLYLAFNRAIAEEASRLFPSRVDCRTAHSLAYQAVGHRYAARLQAPLTPARVAEQLRLGKTREGMPAATWAALVLGVLKRFTQSDRDAVAPADVAPAQAGRPELAAALVRDASAVWSAMIDPRGSLPIEHDTYLKLWTLEAPRLAADFILFDEAQDANAAMVRLVAAQSAQTVWVGDRYQQIYAWRGAMNAMDAVACRNTTRITQSFRFGPRIAALANSVLAGWLGADLRVRGNPKLASRIGACEPEAILCRTNAGAVAAAVSAREAGKRVCFAGGVGETLAQLGAARELRAGRVSAHPELAGFASWEELEARAESVVELQPLVRMVKAFDLDRLIGAMKGIAGTSEAQAELIVSTAHKSKGREWGRVRLAEDFRHPDSPSYSPEDANLLYVAVTRARQDLDIRGCEAALRAKRGAR